MQIKFLNIYHYQDEPCQIQYELLGFWQNAIVHDQINFIHNAKIEFNDYSFVDYPDQEKLNKEINNKTSYHLNGKQFWQALGKRYEIFENMYNDLAASYRLMELTISPEGYD
jgi:hypothetical protein